MPSVIQQMKDPGPGEEENEEDETGLMGLGFTDRGKLSFGGGSQKKSSAAERARHQIVESRVVLTAKQEEDIAQAFESFDVTGTGYMSAVDLPVGLRALGFDASKQEMIKLLSMFDPGKTGRLCFVDFMTIIEMKLDEPDTKEDLEKAYNLFDKDRTGMITIDNLREVADELEEDINDEELAVGHQYGFQHSCFVYFYNKHKLLCICRISFRKCWLKRIWMMTEE